MAIQLNNVRFAYPETPDITVINIPHWSVSQQERLFVHGPSGCGKSTLLNLVSGILTTQRGEVSVLGQSLDTMKASQRDRFRAHNIGVVFQQFNLIPYLSAIENVLLAQYFSREKRQDTIKKPSNQTCIAETPVDATHLLADLGINNRDQHKPASKLSIGQQQRVAIARAMINHPQLLIADEPTSSLDKKNCDAFLTLLMSLVKAYDTTLLFVSHDLSLANYFDRSESIETINLTTGID